MLPLPEDLLFVCELAYLLMSWHVFHLSKWLGGVVRKILVKNFVVGDKILIIKRGCIMDQVNFLKGLQGVFGEKRKLHNLSIIK